MAAKLSGSSSKRYNARRSFAPMSEINVTPMVDVMLVLLVIFMVTAPLLTTGIPVELPKTHAAPLSESVEPLTIVVNSQGQIFIQETETPLEDLTNRLIAITGNNPEARIYVRGDQNLTYGLIMQVMGTIGGAGYTKVALLTDPTPLKSSKPHKKKDGTQPASKQIKKG